VTNGSTTSSMDFFTQLSLSEDQQLLNKSQSITVKSATFRLLDTNSQTVQLAETDVSSRTATVAIDFGAKGDGECDGLSDLVEREQGTFPDNADSNSDAISNAVELYGWLTSFSAPLQCGNEFGTSLQQSP
jgi:hypothetical protein